MFREEEEEEGEGRKEDEPSSHQINQRDMPIVVPKESRRLTASQSRVGELGLVKEGGRDGIGWGKEERWI